MGKAPDHSPRSARCTRGRVLDPCALPLSRWRLGSAEGGPGISRVIVADAADLTVDQFLTLQCSIRPQHPVEAVTPGSVSAQATRIGGGSVPFEVEWYFVEHAGKLIGLSIIDPETTETLVPVVQSLRLQGG